MFDQLHNVQPGDAIEAAQHNLLIQAVKRVLTGMGYSDATGSAVRQRARGLADVGTLRVLNTTGETLVKGQIVGLDDPIYIPTLNPLAEATQEFWAGCAIKVVKPLWTKHLGRWAIMQNQTDDDETGVAIASGICVAPIQVSSMSHRAVDIVDNNCNYLQTCDSGGGQILYHAATEPGAAWALISVQPVDAIWCWAEITGSTQVSDNKWSYNWRECLPTTPGLWVPRPSGKNDAALGVAYNTFEANNSGAGLQGSGDNQSTLPAGVTLLPIGNAVVQMRLQWDCDQSLMAVFSHPNNTGGVCS